MKIFVINLDERKDRLDHVSNQLLNYQWERFSAISGKNLNYKDIRNLGFDIYNKWLDPLVFRNLTYNEVACSISHYMLWEKCIELDEPVLVLEDDIILKDVIDFDYLKYLLQAYDIVYLNHREMDSNNAIKLDNLVIPSYPYLGSAYIITPHAAKVLTSTSYKKNLIPVDEYMPIMIGNKCCLTNSENIFNNFKHLIKLFTADNIRLNAIGFSSNVIEQLSRDIMGSDIEQSKKIPYQVAVATVATDTLKANFLFSSAKKHNVNITNLGDGVKWHGGDMSGPGGGQKINLILEYVSKLHDEAIFMFVDGYDVIINDDMDTIVSRFKSFDCDILFAAEKTCWPDSTLDNLFPTSTTGYRFLNSGCFIGYAGELKKILKNINDETDDQLFLQKQFIDQLYNKHDVNIKLDTENYIFQCLAGAEDEVKILTNRSFRQLFNIHTNTCPCIVHCNGPTKSFLDNIFNLIFDPSIEFDLSKPLQPVITDMLVGSFLSTQDCLNVINIAENANKWESMYGDKFPGQEVRVRQLGADLFNSLSEKFMKHIVPSAEKYWFPLQVYGIRDMFIIKYSPDTQASLNCHHDASLISGIVRLNSDYEGGDTYFYRQNYSNKDVSTGDILVWPGQVTHGHEGRKVTSGTKYNLVIWTSRYQGDING